MAGRCNCSGASVVGVAATGSGCTTVTGAGTAASPFVLGLDPTCIPVKSTDSGHRTPSPVRGQIDFQSDQPYTPLVYWDGFIWRPVDNFRVPAISAAANGTAFTDSKTPMVIPFSVTAVLDSSNNAHVPLPSGFSFPTIMQMAFAINGDASVGEFYCSTSGYILSGFDVHCAWSDGLNHTGIQVRLNGFAAGW